MTNAAMRAWYPVTRHSEPATSMTIATASNNGMKGKCLVLMYATFPDQPNIFPIPLVAKMYVIIKRPSRGTTGLLRFNVGSVSRLDINYVAQRHRRALSRCVSSGILTSPEARCGANSVKGSASFKRTDSFSTLVKGGSALYFWA